MSTRHAFTDANGREYVIDDRGHCLPADQLHPTITAAEMLASSHPTVREPRREAARWLRALADRVESGEVEAIEVTLAAMRRAKDDE